MERRSPEEILLPYEVASKSSFWNLLFREKEMKKTKSNKKTTANKIVISFWLAEKEILTFRL